MFENHEENTILTSYKHFSRFESYKTHSKQSHRPTEYHSESIQVHMNLLTFSDAFDSLSLLIVRLNSAQVLEAKVINSTQKFLI